MATAPLLPSLLLALALLSPDPGTPAATAPGLPAPAARSQHGSPSSPESTGPRAVWPLQPQPRVVAGFAPPAERWAPGHRGVDLLGRPGQPVRAAVAGRVSHVGRVAGVGVVAVSHGATRTTYQPVVGWVALGARVAAGEAIGALDVRGGHCLPRACLHWGLLRGRTYLDPLSLLDAPRPVRLYPW